MSGPSKLALVGGAAAAVVAVVPLAIKKLRKGGPGTTPASEYEFGGPPGAYSTMVALPGVIYMLYYACGKDFVMPGANVLTLANMRLPDPSEFLSTKAVGLFLGWFGFQVALERFLPGEVVEGTDLAPAGGSGRLKYRMNGHLAFWVSLLGLAPLAMQKKGGLSVLYDEYPAIAGASILFSMGLSSYLYATSFAPGALLAKGGDTGNAIYDFFIGRELNPRIGSFDLKQFCELRPGLIGWVALNLGMACKQYQNTGSVSGAMMLVNFLQGLYVWDALYQEQAILSTMDITTDGFGYMLAFGDLAWVPFTYGVQARYLVDNDPGLPAWGLGVIGALGLGAYVVFRASNSEKDRFRRNPKDPSVAHLEVLEVTNHLSGRPSKLLVSGWWGLARKINYTGDWCMAWMWSMCTGCPFIQPGSLLTYFYPIYFAILLIHRAGRDDHFCSQKYGADWKKYKKLVPYLFIPYVI